MAAEKAWSEDAVNPLKVELDTKNPRIEAAKATQAQIREKLLAYEDVLDLARKIAKSGGLLYGDRIILLIENQRYVVAEGNRRVAACQMLLDPSLIPTSYKSRFPKASPALKRSILSIKADVAPNRAAAEPILTRRHTEQTAKPWTPVAKMRRAARWLADGKTFEEVADELGTSVSSVRKLVRPYKLLRFAMQLGGWTKGERAVLEDEKLKVNPYTRFFTLKDTKGILGLSFDEHENVKSSLPNKVFRDQMARVARDFLLPDPAAVGKRKGKPRMDTRTQPAAYFRDFFATPEGKAAAAAMSAQAQKVSSRAPASARPSTPRASVFMEKVLCHINDDNLIQLSEEIRGINHDRRPVAASMLLRALLECALKYKLQQDKKWEGLVKGANGRDPQLQTVLHYCANEKHAVFSEKNIAKILGSSTTQEAKTYLDSIIHGSYRQADPSTLESHAANLRSVIQYILEGK